MRESGWRRLQQGRDDRTGRNESSNRPAQGGRAILRRDTRGSRARITRRTRVGADTRLRMRVVPGWLSTSTGRRRPTSRRRDSRTPTRSRHARITSTTSRRVDDTSSTGRGGRCGGGGETDESTDTPRGIAGGVGRVDERTRADGETTGPLNAVDAGEGGFGGELVEVDGRVDGRGRARPVVCRWGCSCAVKLSV